MIFQDDSIGSIVGLGRARAIHRFGRPCLEAFELEPGFTVVTRAAGPVMTSPRILHGDLDRPGFCHADLGKQAGCQKALDQEPLALAAGKSIERQIDALEVVARRAPLGRTRNLGTEAPRRRARHVTAAATNTTFARGPREEAVLPFGIGALEVYVRSNDRLGQSDIVT